MADCQALMPLAAADARDAAVPPEKPGVMRLRDSELEELQPADSAWGTRAGEGPR